MIGWLAGILNRGRGFGITGDILTGIVGAMLGGWLVGRTGLSTNSLVATLLLALVGAVVLVGVTRFIVRETAVN
ncbi:MAG: GlsB/YeaQ/YmgE family stress response membrane protein [Candidatus Omnitrophica bacterium]|nr:GlsB/YeaQ/YmgE family stress response membrane protein [Candidatus Omnitrophota bacterium]